jgi:hypothetical protein
MCVTGNFYPSQCPVSVLHKVWDSVGNWGFNLLFPFPRYISNIYLPHGAQQCFQALCHIESHQE